MEYAIIQNVLTPISIPFRLFYIDILKINTKKTTIYKTGFIYHSHFLILGGHTLYLSDLSVSLAILALVLQQKSWAL